MSARPTEDPHARCRHPDCATDLFFVITEKGKRMPVDADSARCSNDQDGCEHEFHEHGGEHGAECNHDGCLCPVFELAEDYNPRKHKSHFGTCKDPKRFSGRGGNSKRRATKGGA